MRSLVVSHRKVRSLPGIGNYYGDSTSFAQTLPEVSSDVKVVSSLVVKLPTYA